MDYKRQYDLLIEKARQRGTVEGYKEKHHIIPKCMGGSNKKENLVELTAREHYVAHRLLYAQYRTRQMAQAWNGMCRAGKHHAGRIFSNRQYERARIAFSESQKKYKVRTTSVKWSEEHRKKLRDAQTGKKLSDETRKKIGLAHKGKYVGEQTRKKMSEWQIGRVFSEETKRKISEAKKRKLKESLNDADI